MTEPGLILRETVARAPGVSVVRELWDIAAPGCPMSGLRLSSFGIDRSETVIEVMHQQREGEYAHLTDAELTALEERLYDDEIDGEDTWFERDQVLWEMNSRRMDGNTR